MVQFSHNGLSKLALVSVQFIQCLLSQHDEPVNRESMLRKKQSGKFDNLKMMIMMMAGQTVMRL